MYVCNKTKTTNWRVFQNKNKAKSKQNHINQAKNKYASALDAACELVFRGLY